MIFCDIFDILKIMRTSELKIQAEACKFIWNKYPQTRYCLIHVANEAKRSAIEWSMLKSAGFIKGAQDLEFRWNNFVYFIEVKANGGKIDPWQKVVHCANSKQGFNTWVLWSAKDIILFIEDVMKGNVKDWNSKISPYCNFEDINILIKQAKQSDCKHNGNPCTKCQWTKFDKLINL